MGTNKRNHMPRKYNPAILSEKPILKAFDNVGEAERTHILLFALAYSNRMMWRSAIEIRHQLQLTKPLNTLTVRYLLLISFMTDTRPTTTHCIELADYPKRDPKRLCSMLRLNEMGLAVLGKTPKGGNTMHITDLGRKAIAIIARISTETIHAHPKKSMEPRPHRVETPPISYYI